MRSVLGKLWLSLTGKDPAVSVRGCDLPTECRAGPVLERAALDGDAARTRALDGPDLEATARELTVNRIIDVRFPTAQVAGQVSTDASGVLRVVRPDHAKILATLASMDALASVEFTKGTREVSGVGSSPCDVVLGVALDATEARIQLMMRPTLLSLDLRHPRFATLRKLLEASKRERTFVHIGVLPGGSRIEDVRAGTSSL